MVDAVIGITLGVFALIAPIFLLDDRDQERPHEKGMKR